VHQVGFSLREHVIISVASNFVLFMRHYFEAKWILTPKHFVKRSYRTRQVLWFISYATSPVYRVHESTLGVVDLMTLTKSQIN